MILQDIYFKNFDGTSNAHYEPIVGTLVCSSSEVRRAAPPSEKPALPRLCAPDVMIDTLATVYPGAVFVPLPWVSSLRG